MSRFERRMHHLSTLLVGGTGLVYAVMRYLLEPADPWTVVGHPWQPHVQHLHILSAPLLVFVVGLSWQGHIVPRWRKTRMPGFLTGIVLLLSFLPMIVSGALIQTTVSEGWRTAWVVVHLVTSLLWMAGYLSHQLGERVRIYMFSRRQRSRGIDRSMSYDHYSMLCSRPQDASPRSDHVEVSR